MSRVVEFEGVTHEFPDDATDNEVAAALGGHSAPAPAPAATFTPAPRPNIFGNRTPPPATTPAPPMTWGDVPAAAGRAATVSASGIGNGLAHVAGMPIDLPTGVANLGLFGADKIASVFGGEVPFRVPALNVGEHISDAAAGATQALGLPYVPPDQRSDKENLFNNVLDYATQAAAGGTGLARIAATKGAEAINAGATAMGPRVANAFLRPYVNKPVAAVAADTAAGAGAGAGHDAANTYFPGNPLADFIATMAGGGVGSGALNLAKLIPEKTPLVGQSALMKRTKDFGPNDNLFKADGTGYSKTDVEQAARTMQDRAKGVAGDAAAPAAAAQNITQAATDFRAAGVGGEALPTSARMSGNPNLVARENKDRAADPGAYVTRDKNVSDQASTMLNAVKDPTADQSAVKAQAGVSRDAALAPLNADVQSAERTGATIDQGRQAEGAALAAKKGEDVKTNASVALDKAIVDDTYLNPDVPISRPVKNEEFLSAQAPGTPIDTSKMASKAAEIRAKVEALPEAVQSRVIDKKLLDDLEKSPTMSYEAASQVRMELSDSAAQAHADGQHALGRNIMALKNSLSDSLDAAAPVAAKNYKENYAPAWRPGPGDAMAGFTKKIDRDSTRTTTPPEKTAGTFLAAPEKAAAVARVLAASPAGPAGQQAVRDYLHSNMATAALNPDGTVNRLAAAKWLNNNAAVLEKFPEAKKEFQAIVDSATRGDAAAKTAATDLSAARDKLNLSQRELDQGVTGNLLNKDPRAAADEMLGEKWNGPKTADEVNRVLGANQAAKDGWKAAVAEAMAKRVTGTAHLGDSADYAASMAKVAQLFKDNRETLAKVFTPEEMNNLQQAHKLLETFRAGAQRATTGSDTAEKVSMLDTMVGKAAQLAIRHMKGNLEGGGSIARFRTALSMLPAGEQGFNELIHKAAFDPDLAAYLLNKKVRNFDSARANKYVRQIIRAESAANTAAEGDNK